jgi:hypothetical protein
VDWVISKSRPEVEVNVDKRWRGNLHTYPDFTKPRWCLLYPWLLNLPSTSLTLFLHRQPISPVDQQWTSTITGFIASSSPLESPHTPLDHVVNRYRIWPVRLDIFTWWEIVPGKLADQIENPKADSLQVEYANKAVEAAGYVVAFLFSIWVEQSDIKHGQS